MRNRLWVVVVVFVLGASACNLPTAQATKTPLTTSMPDTPMSGISTPTLTPVANQLTAELPTSIPTSTSSVFLASSKGQPVNCRFGPGTSYAVTGALIVGRQAEIIGRSQDSSWWYVRNPSDPSTSCWLSAEFVQTLGNVEALPVVNPPAIMVTGIQVQIDPPVTNVACGAFPQIVVINAQITTSGPATVVWHWESGTTGTVSQDKQILFEAGDTKTVQDYYQVNGVNDYKVQVQTTSPNIMTGQATFKVICTP